MLNRWIEDDLLPVTREEGVGVIAFCPLAQGLLTDKYLNGVPEDSRAKSTGGFLKPEGIKPEIIEKVKALNEVANERGQSLAQMSLSWVLRDERVTSALIGASRPEQIVENLAAANNTRFSDDELKTIDGIVKDA
jgi:L-glyceraldehyde 3-phosphate reductase